MAKASTASSPPIELRGDSVPDGKVADFLTGRHLNDTPEEYVRQNLEKALVRQYRYEPADCEPEFRIKVGSSRKYVDVAIFSPGSEHKQENLIVIVECKKPGTSPNARIDGIAQLQSCMAASLNAKYGLWTNGDDRYCFARRDKASGHEFEEIIEIPSFGQSEADAQRPRRRDLRPATAHNLLFAFRRCHNYIAANQGKQKPEAFWELLKLIFCKIEDERSSSLNFFVTPSERASATGAAPARARIEKMFADKVVRKYPSIFPGQDSRIDLAPGVLVYVVSQLQGISLLASPVDVKGIAYEEIVGSNLRGDRGEFFTPRSACRMAVAMLNPQPRHKILDPACGTGGFLITAMNHSLAQIEDDERSLWLNPSNGSDEERHELYRKRSEYLSQNVFGIDLNPGLVRAAKMNMVMNHDGSGGLFQGNSLENPHTWSPELGAAMPLESMDVVVTNPPFGANITIDDENILKQYDLAAVWDQSDTGRWGIRLDRNGVVVLQKSQPPEILFIERCLQLLQPGTGRLAMVIPNGILNNPALSYVREWILMNAQVLAVVDMARELFQPNNDTQTSMMLLRRFSAEEKATASQAELDYPIFMAVAERIGHDKRGNVLWRRTDTGDDVVSERVESVSEIDPVSGKEILSDVAIRDRVIDDELPDVAQAYQDWLAEHAP